MPRLVVLAKRPIALTAGAALLAVGLSGCLGWFIQFSSAGENLASIACPTAATCVAVGSGPDGALIEQTTNGGGSWNSESPAGVPALVSVSCSGTTSCVAVGGDSVLSTNNGGASWTTLTVSLPQVLAGLPPTDEDSVFTSVSCAGEGYCWATTSTNTIEVTTDGGATWTGETWPVPSYAGGYAYTNLDVEYDNLQISCPSVNVCEGVGEQYYIIYPPPEATIPMLVVDTGIIITTTDGGQSWSAESLNEEVFTAVSCSSTTSCLTFGTDGAYALTPGEAVTSVAANPSPLSGGLDCLNNGTCVAVGATDSPEEAPVQSTADGGMSWQPQPTPDSSSADLQSISCISASSCWAVGNDSNGAVILHTITGGVAWPSVTGISPAQGPVAGGTTVTVTGVHFDLGVTSVSFGTATTTALAVVSPSELTVTAPPAPGGVAMAVDVQVNSPLGSSPLYTPDDTFTYVSG